MSGFSQSDASWSRNSRPTGGFSGPSDSGPRGGGGARGGGFGSSEPSGNGDDKWSKAFKNLSKGNDGPPPVRNERNFGDRAPPREGGG
ncbi:hypothetical protein EON65_50770, partial [archaeon]